MDLTRFVRFILNLFPRGSAWIKEPGTLFYGLAQGMADEAGRISMRAANLIEEGDPRTTKEGLEDFERMVGLPDECSVDGQTIEERKQAVIARMTMQGSLSKKFYQDLAASLGFQVEVKNYRKFKAGRGRAGEPISNGNWIYTWRVEGPADVTRRFKAGQNRAGDPLRVVGNKLLECTITKNKPAGTIVVFSYQA